MANFSFTSNNSDSLSGSSNADLFYAEASNPSGGNSFLSSSDKATGGDGTDRMILAVNDIISPDSSSGTDSTRCDVAGFTLDSIEEIELKAYDMDGDKIYGNGEVVVGMMNVTGVSRVLSSISTANVTLDYLKEPVALDLKGNGVRGTSFTLNYTNKVNVAPPGIFSQSINLAGFGDRITGEGSITVDAVTGFIITAQEKASTVILNGKQASTLDLNLKNNLTLLPDSSLPELQMVKGLPTMPGALSISVPSSSKNISITTGLGADSIQTGQGSDTIISGDGNDTILPGSGQDRIDLGVGNDVVRFSYKPGDPASGFSWTDTISGGEGNDTISFLPGETIDLVLTDRSFGNWLGIETLDVTAAQASAPTGGTTATNLTLGVKAAAQGLQTVVTGNGDDSIKASRFDKPLTIQLNDGMDSVDASKAGLGSIKIMIKDAFLKQNDTLVAGSASDELQITASNSTATLMQVKGFEKITLVNEITTGNNTNNIKNRFTQLITGNEVVAKGKTLEINGSRLEGVDIYTGLKFDGSQETDGNFKVTGSIGNDRLQGGAGADTLSGGNGKDSFFYTSEKNKGEAGKDTILDFKPSTDSIKISGTAGRDNKTPISELNFVDNVDTETAALAALKNSSDIPNDRTLSAVFVRATETVWIDLDENGTLDNMDLQIEVIGINELSYENFSISKYK